MGQTTIFSCCLKDIHLKNPKKLETQKIKFYKWIINKQSHKHNKTVFSALVSCILIDPEIIISRYENYNFKVSSIRLDLKGIIKQEIFIVIFKHILLQIDPF